METKRFAVVLIGIAIIGAVGAVVLLPRFGVSVPAKPAKPLDFSYSGSSSNPDTFSFNATSGYASYSWGFGDSSGAVGQNVTHTYASSVSISIFNVTLTASFAGKEYLASHIITVYVSNSFSVEMVYFYSQTNATVAVRNLGKGMLTISAWDWQDSNGNHCSTPNIGWQIPSVQVGFFNTDVSGCTLRFYSGFIYTLTLVSSGGTVSSTSWVK